MSEDLKYCEECGTANSVKNSFCEKCKHVFSVSEPELKVSKLGPKQWVKFNKPYNYKLSRRKIAILILILLSWGLIYYVTTKREKAQVKQAEPAIPPITAATGEQVMLGNFIYEVNTAQLRKAIGNEVLTKTADGLYLIIGLSVKNISPETRLIDHGLFKLIDKDNNQFEASGEGGSALEMEGKTSLFLKQCLPGIQNSGFLVFEVPKKKLYELHLSDGSWKGKTARVYIK